MNKNIFREYDIRGVYPTDINEDGTPKTDKDGNIIPNYWKYEASEFTNIMAEYNSIRIEGENGIEEDGKQYFYVYGRRVDGGIEVRAEYYEYYIYQHNEVKKDGIKEPTFWFGTTQTGKDIFACLAYGARFSFIFATVVAVVNFIVGVIWGSISGYFGGMADMIIMRCVDVVNCFPVMFLIIIVATILKPSIYNVMIIIGLCNWTGTARLVRGQILSLREQEYMVAAEAMGYSTPRKIFKHLVPNVMPQLIVSMTLSLGSMILYEASLSYLNMGVRAPYAAWGTMINIVAEDQYILENFFNVWGPPGLCIILAVLGFNFVGDGLRDALDPKGRR